MTIEQKKEIEQICIRLEHSITELDILQWLGNFEELDWDNALKVLSFLDYYSFDRIINSLKNGIAKVLFDFPDKTIYVTPLGPSGKSGQVMAYYANKVIKHYFSDKKVILISKASAYKKELSDNVLAYLDDFAGTGGTFVKNATAKLPPHTTVVFITIAYMTKAAKSLEVPIYGDEHTPCFAQRGSVFGYPPKMRIIRDFCEKYSDQIPHPPYGYDNSQAIVSFEHSTPNNTLPIIWYSSEKWQPLFPRFIQSRIDRVKSYREGRDYWLSIVYKSNFCNDAFLRLSKYSTTAVKLFNVIFLKRQGRTPLTICQLLGISGFEYDEIVHIGQDCGYFDEDEHLTEAAVQLYNDIDKRNRIINSHLPQKLSSNKHNELYLPKTFQGVSRIPDNSDIDIPF